MREALDVAGARSPVRVHISAGLWCPKEPETRVLQLAFPTFLLVSPMAQPPFSALRALGQEVLKSLPGWGLVEGPMA